MTDDSTPWAMGLTVAAFVAAVTAAAIVVLSMGLTRVHPLLAVGLNLVAVGGLAPTVWGWRNLPVWRWFVLGSGVGVGAAWLALLAMAPARSRPGWPAGTHAEKNVLPRRDGRLTLARPRRFRRRSR